MTAQQAAHLAVLSVLRSGDLTRQPCEECRKPDPAAPTVAHHDDYAEPLAVRWLCRPHHNWWHQQHGHAKGWEAPAAPAPRLGSRKTCRSGHPRFSGKALANARRRAAFPQFEFARLLGIGCRTLQRYEAGDDVPNANIAGNAAVLAGCTLDSLYDDTPPA